MSHLAKLIAGKIRVELALTLGADKNESSLRVFFSGPPSWVLEAVYGSLLSGEESLVITHQNERTTIPVFLLKSDVEDPVGGVKSAICSENYFVAAVRNNPAVTRCLILQDHISSVKSVDTTVTRLGGHLDFKEFDSWYESAWIQSIIDVFLEKLAGTVEGDKFKAALKHTLFWSWELESGRKSKNLVWRMLESVSEMFGAHTDVVSLAKINNRLGLVNCEYGAFGTSTHIALNEKITTFFENRGLSAGFDQLREKASEQHRVALQELQDELVVNHVIQASDLSDKGLHNLYGASKTCDGIPEYWSVLTLDVWKDLLDEEDVPTEDEIVIEVRPIGTLVDAQNGLPHLSQGRVDFEIQHSHDSLLELVIERSVGGTKYTLLDSVELVPDASHVFSDCQVPNHQTYVRYRVSAVGHESLNVIQKWIVLNTYGPGVVITSRAAKKLKPFKLNKKALGPSGEKLERYESDLSFRSMGQFQIEFFASSEVNLPESINGFEVDSEHSELVCSVSKDGIALIQTDEECYYDFTVQNAIGEESAFRIFITADDTPPQGVSSEFDRLVESHLNGGVFGINAKVEALKGRLYDLELQILESPSLSHKPVILGPDYFSAWSKIDWNGKAKISNLGLMHDLRPENWEALVPDSYVEARTKLFEILSASNDGAVGAAELRLHEFSSDEAFITALNALLKSYFDWLGRDYESAIWAETFSFFDSPPSTHGLSAKPYAVFISPFHPIKLGYQFEAQRLMFEAIVKHQECPAASLFTPSRFPDVLSLQHRTVSGNLDSIDFIGVESANPYWGVFWSMDEVSRQDYGKLSMDLSDSFQLGLRGLTTGFTSQQMVKSLDEVSKLLSAKTTLTLQLHSDDGGDSDCNLGVEAWASERMTTENDVWSASGALRVDVYDSRPVDMQPEQSTLAALTMTTDSNLKWHTHCDESIIDLSVIASLNATQPQFSAQSIESAVDVLGLSRSRIRKRLLKHYLAESLVMRRVASDNESLKDVLLAAVAFIEEKLVQNGHDGFMFAPNVLKLEEVLNDSKYTAVSSSNIDFQSFADIGKGNSFLWDYELPSYSRSVGGADGYYLLATHSEGMDAAVRTALKEFGAQEDKFDDAAIKLLLSEVSKRGMPTLKRLTGGGTLTMGELGMLAAVRLLQPDFSSTSTVSPVFPIKGQKGNLCLIVPVDPFQGHVDSLRKSLHKRTGERPDLLSLSLQFDNQILRRIKIVAIEVKARRGELGSKGRSSAISQASHFSNFLIELKGKGAETDIWGLAWRSLLISFVDYSFRVYSGASHIMDEDEWFELHSEAVHALSSGRVDVNIDSCGRLISIEGIDKPSFVDTYDGDQFDESIVLNHNDALGVISGTASTFSEVVRGKVDGWSLDFAESLSTATDTATDTDTDTPTDTDSAEVIASPEDASDDSSKSDNDNEPKCDTEIDKVGLRFEVGQTVGHFDNYALDFYPANTALNQLNVGIVGDLGTGKTQLIKSLIFQLSSRASQNRGVSPNILIFDYKRDYSNTDFVEATGAKVVSPYDIPLNIFDLPESPNKNRAQHERSRFFIDVLDKIYSGIGPVQKENIKSAVKQAYKNFELSERSPTLRDVFECYKEEGKIDIPYSIMSNLVDSEYFVAHSEKVIPFRQFLNGVVVVDLSQILADDDKNMLVAIFLNLFYEYMLSVEKKPFLGTSPSLRFVDTMLLVDEADNIMKYEFEVLRKLLLQGREFGIGVLLASQYLSHFKTRHENYLEPLLTWFIHKVPNITARELENIGITSDLERMASKIRSLECHQCLYKSLGVDGEIMRGTPFFELLNAANVDSK